MSGMPCVSGEAVFVLGETQGTDLCESGVRYQIDTPRPDWCSESSPSRGRGGRMTHVPHLRY